jgi:hypothetical protein
LLRGEWQPAGVAGTGSEDKHGAKSRPAKGPVPLGVPKEHLVDFSCQHGSTSTGRIAEDTEVAPMWIFYAVVINY